MEDQRTQTLRKSIREIQADPSIPAAEKGRRIQALMSGKIIKEQEKKPMVLDKSITYHNAALKILGCKHYRRGCKKMAACCGQLFSCRFCHDAVSDHPIDRYQTREMMCMHCSTVQPIQQSCANPACGKELARYYCDICKFHDDAPNKSIYHCDQCGLCRLREKGDEYFHCEKCCMCLALSLKNNHKCIENTMKSNCPICNKDMFSSTTPSMIHKCGHSIHITCYNEYLRQGEYTCPVCLKSVIDMSAHWRQLDAIIAASPMPAEFANMKAGILCNDCELRSESQFHFYGHRCPSCGGYNTKVLSTTGAPSHQDMSLASLEPAPATTSQVAEPAAMDDDSAVSGLPDAVPLVVDLPDGLQSPAANAFSASESSSGDEFETPETSFDTEGEEEEHSS